MISLVSRTETLPLWPRFENYLNTFLLFGHLSNSSPLVLLSHLFRFWQRCSGTLAPVLRTRRYTTSAVNLSGAVGPVPVPLDPAGKVFTYLFSSVVQLK